jgi:hypothetical protein
MGAHCRTDAQTMHHPGSNSAANCQKFCELATMTLLLRVLGAAFGTFISKRMTPGNYLRNRCHNTRTQATATNYQVAETIQQPVAHIVFCNGGHNSSP